MTGPILAGLRGTKITDSISYTLVNRDLARGGSLATQRGGEQGDQRRAAVVGELQEEAGHGGRGHRRRPVG
jgi:hypothetical protein